MKRLCVLFCVFCSLLRLFPSDKALLPQKNAFSKIQSIERDKQELHLFQADSNSSGAKKTAKTALRDKIRLSVTELETNSYRADSNDTDFSFSLSESEDSFTFTFSLGGKIVYSGKGSVPSVQGKMCETAEFIYTISADKEKDSAYFISPRAIKLLTKDGRVIYQKEINGRVVPYSYIPATSFSWKDESVEISSTNTASTPKKTFLRGMDVQLPFTLCAEDGELHSVGFDLTVDLHFRPYVFLGGTLGFSGNESSATWLLLEILKGIASSAESNKRDSKKSESPPPKNYGTATVRAGAYFPLTPDFNSFLPAVTIQTFVEGGFVDSRPAYGYGINAAIHSNPAVHAGGCAGLFVSYSHFRTSGNGNFHKGAIGLYVKFDTYYK